MPLLRTLDYADPTKGVALVGLQGDLPVLYLFDPQYSQDILFAYGAVGDGRTDDADAIQAAADDAAAAGEVLVIRRKHFLLTSVSINAMLRFEAGGQLIWADGTTLNINNYIFAGPWCIFAGQRLDTDAVRVADDNDRNRLHITMPQILLPEWFGAVPSWGVVAGNNCKPAYQRMAHAAPPRFGMIHQRGHTYLFGNGGLSFRADRPCTAVFTERLDVDVDLNGATLRLDDNTRYCMLLFLTSTVIDPNADSFAPTCDNFCIYDGTVDGNRAGNEAQWLDQVVNQGGSVPNKGYGALVLVKGYKRAEQRDVVCNNNIHYGIDFQECASNFHIRPTGKGGYPMQYDGVISGVSIHDQASNAASRGNFSGSSVFEDWDFEGGSHHITRHTTLNDQDPKEAAYSTCTVRGGRSLNWAESMIHIESGEDGKIIGSKGEINDVTYSSLNVADIFIRAYSRRSKKLVSFQVDDVTLINGTLTVDDELGNGNNRVGRVLISDSVLEKNLNGLASDVCIKAPNSGVVRNCRVAGTVDTPLAPPEHRSIVAQRIEDCTIEYGPAVECYEHMSGKMTNIIGDRPAIICNSPDRCVVDVELDTAYAGIQHKGGDLVVSGVYRTLQSCVIQSDLPDGDDPNGSIQVNDARFVDWGLNANHDIFDPGLAAIGGFAGTGNGAMAPEITLDNVRFMQLDPTASKMTLRANNANQVVVIKDCSGTPGLSRPSFVGNGNCYFESFAGQEAAITGAAGEPGLLDVLIATVATSKGFPWSTMSRVTLSLGAVNTTRIGHVFSQSQNPVTFEGVVIEVYITAAAKFAFTFANGDDSRAKALRHIAGMATWDAAAGSYMRLTWAGKYWLCSTVDA